MTAVFDVGVKAPSAPVLPLLKVCAVPVLGHTRSNATPKPPSHRCLPQSFNPALICVDICNSLPAPRLSPRTFPYGIDTLTGGDTLMLLPVGGVCAGKGRNTLPFDSPNEGTAAVTVTFTGPLCAVPAGLTTEKA